MDDTGQQLSPCPILYRSLPYTPFRQPVFTSKSKYKWIQQLKLLLGALIILPIRIVWTVIFFYLSLLVSWILTYNQPKVVLDMPPDISESNWGIILLNRINRLTLFGMGLTSIEFRGKVPVDYDQEHPWCKYSVVAAPHSATFDWCLIVARATRLFSPQIKSEIGGNSKVINNIRCTMPILVDRNSPTGRKQAALETIRRMKEGVTKGWFPLICFPEGTNGNRKQLLRFKAGAFLSGEPIIPVLIKYENDESEDESHNDLTSWPHFGRSVPVTLLLCMCRFQTRIVYTFLDTYHPTEQEQKNPSLYAENVRQVMAKELKIEPTEWSFGDAKLMRQAQRAKLQPEIGAIQTERVFAGIKNAERFSSDLLDKYLMVLKKYAEVNTALVEFKDVENILKPDLLPVVEKTTLLKEIFGEELAVPHIFKDQLPSYVSFKQYCIVHVRYMKTQKID